MRTGIYFCLEVDDNLDIRAVSRYASSMPGIVDIRWFGIQPRLDAPSLAEMLKRKNVERVVIAGGRPGLYKSAFTRALALAGQDPAEVRLAAFRPLRESFLESMERIELSIACAAHALPYPLSAVLVESRINPATLIIGGGIAGIQAALEIAEAGQQVYLVERTGTLGGHAAMFGRTFPALECAACILTPKMVAASQQDQIKLLTNSELVQVSGKAGSYQARILKKARYVDEKSCVTCGLCSEVCPVRVPSGFDAGITTRKAIYLPFQQAVPNAFLVDAANCLYQTNQTCGACARKCPNGCVNLDEKDEFIEIEVGSIVMATGYDVLDAHKIGRYGYGKHPNVLTALEFERLANDSGPTGGRIVCRTQKFSGSAMPAEWTFNPLGVSPRRIAIIHCVGSRDANHNRYCSQVCCMYSLKFAHLVKEKLPDAVCYEFYIDLRAFGKGYEEFAERIRQEGTFMVRGRSTSVTESGNGLVIRGEDIMSDRLLEFPVDMVLLATGLIPAQGSEELSRILGIACDADGWFTELDHNSNPADMGHKGIYVAGACQTPKDITDTVAQASAVAAGVLRHISSGRSWQVVSGISLKEIEARSKSLQE